MVTYSLYIFTLQLPCKTCQCLYYFAEHSYILVPFSYICNYITSCTLCKATPWCNNRITYSTYFLASPCTLSLSSEKAIRSIWYATICLSKFLDCTYSSNCCTCQSILPPHNTSHPCIFSHFITPFYYMEHIARCIALLLYSSKWITLSSVNCFNTGNAIEKMNESATSTKRPRILLPPFYIDCYRLLLFRHFYKIFSTIFYLLQFTTPSGLHSVLERPFSEANGRPFLVKRSPLIVCWSW